MAYGVMMQRAAVAQRHPNHVALSSFSRLADCFGNLSRFSVPMANPAFLVAGNNKGGKAEPTTAFHYLGDAVYGDKLVDDIAFRSVEGLASGHVLSYS
jgi:hypothetical protein